MSIAKLFKLTFMLLSILIFVAATPHPSPAIRGKVVDIQGSRVKIEYEGEDAPSTGDPVKIGFEIGEDFVPVEGEWKIVEADPDFAWARAEGSGTGTPAVDYIAIITARNPRKRSALSPAKKEEDKASGIIPALNAKVVGLRFYASGPDTPPFSERIYKNTFAASKTKHINWELNLQHPEPNQRIDFRVAAIYYRPDGTILTEHSIRTYIRSSWKDSWHSSGWGWPEAGHWKTGQYAVKILVNDRIVANGSFSVY